MTSMLDTLDKRGLVVRLRHATDRRKVLLELTDAGRATLDRFLPGIFRLQTRVMAPLSAAGRRQLRALLDKVLAQTKVSRGGPRAAGRGRQRCAAPADADGGACAAAGLLQFHVLSGDFGCRTNGSQRVGETGTEAQRGGGSGESLCGPPSGRVSPVMDHCSAPGLRLAGIAKAYGGLEVLRGVDLDLPPGILAHIQGANGSGKSTLLRIVAGVTAPTAGTLAARPQTVGYVPERFPPALRFTARSYLRHQARIRGRRREVPEALADRFALSGFLDVPMAHLSKGTAQKVAVLQALAAEPGLLVLDEAWTGLEAGSREALSEAAIARRDAGGIVVFTDHRHRAASLVPDVSYLVAGGGVHPASPGSAPPATVLVELAGEVGDLSPADLGAEVVERQGSRVLLRVAPARSDALLGAALSLGLHVVAVENEA